MRAFHILIYFLFGLNLIGQTIASQPIVPCAINRTDHREAYVAACMMFQNEAEFLKEWIEYHKIIGVKHFYLYNNASTDNFWEVLKPYVKKGQVELFDLFEKTASVEEHNNLQRQAYNHAVSLAKGNNEWLAIIDSDEFICMPQGDNLKKFLKQYLYASALTVNWVMFGSSDKQEFGPEDLQIESFVRRAPDDWGEHFMFKSIVRPKYVVQADIHLCECFPKVMVYPNHQKFSHTPAFKIPPIDQIRINHYWWRHEKYFQEVKLPRRSGWLCRYSDAEIDERRKIYNSIEDHSMKPFIKKIRKRIL